MRIMDEKTEEKIQALHKHEKLQGLPCWPCADNDVRLISISVC